MAYRVRCKVWVGSDEGSVMTPARDALMRQVFKYPSLAEAARALRIPYKKAHRLVASLDERLGAGLVERQAGGPCGGSTRLVDGAVVHGEERRKAGLQPNAIFRVDPVLGDVCLTDPIAGGASFYDTRVNLTKEALGLTRPACRPAGAPQSRSGPP